MGEPAFNRDYWTVHRAARAAQRFRAIAQSHLDHPNEALLEVAEEELFHALADMTGKTIALPEIAPLPTTSESPWKERLLIASAAGFWVLIGVAAVSYLT